jgi:hypothetical protein
MPAWHGAAGSLSSSGTCCAIARSMGRLLALLYFAGFTSLFTLSILWQQGRGRSALDTGLLVVPFAVASLLTVSNSDRFSTGFCRTTILGEASAAQSPPYSARPGLRTGPARVRAGRRERLGGRPPELAQIWVKECGTAGMEPGVAGR